MIALVETTPCHDPENKEPETHKGFFCRLSYIKFNK